MTDTANERDDALLPCPFCGVCRVSVGMAWGGFWKVECASCHAVCGGNLAESAIAAWNTRTSAWIPASESLPEMGEKVLVYEDESGEIYLDELWDNDEDGLWFSIDDFRKVTHWQPRPPLPIPPGGETN